MTPSKPLPYLLLISLSLLLFPSLSKTTLGSQCSAPLTPKPHNGPMWIQTIKHEGTAPFNPSPSSYQVYRNVKDFGAKGDGITDDTAAINAAISSGNRCGKGCDSSTTTPALVFFPSGTYIVSRPIIQYYFTQLVGDAINLPTLQASPSFTGIAVIDSDPYEDGGSNWYTNQNNFYRQVRNFRIDLRKVSGAATGVHWQVAQATSLTNIVFEMSQTPGNSHQGIFMENGSGGFIADLIFNGGKFGMWVGNQQFTSRNITINKADTAVFVCWDWAWTFKSLTINSCNVGVDISNGGESNQNVGSVIILDGAISDTPIAIKTATSPSSMPHTSGSLILDNLRLSNVDRAVVGASNNTIFLGPGTSKTATIDSWGQGQMYKDVKTGKGIFTQGTLPKPGKSNVLLDSNGNFFQRAKPQYENYDISDFVSVKSEGARGDGVTDDTVAIQNVLQKYTGCKIIYFPAGIYLISDTVLIPVGSRIVGEAWSVISATGAKFASETTPKAAVKVGNNGDAGVVEISDLIFSTKGPVPGAILVEWNIRDDPNKQGTAGMWDSHFRIGGAAGTNLQANCVKFSAISANCQGAFALMYLGSGSSAYLENIWAWTADHDLDGAHNQISIYNARGILVESQKGPVWMYGTASEHNVMYQYNLYNTKNIFMGMIQTETPYYQTVPKAPLPFVRNAYYGDPDFVGCNPSSVTCNMAWGLYIENSANVYVYGAGLYNFFQNYDQECLKTESCQDTMVNIKKSTNSVYLYNLNTKAASKMAQVDGFTILQQENRNTFCSTVAGLWTKAPTSTANQSKIGLRSNVHREHA